MAHRVAWSPRAVEDLEAIAQYIAADSAAYAAAVVMTILHTARNLPQVPRSGRVVPEWQMKAFESGSLTAIGSSIALKKSALLSQQ